MKNLWKTCGAWMLVFALLIGMMPMAFAADDDDTVSVSVIPAEDIMAGDTVELSANVQHGGEKISDLSAAGLKLWFWADVWGEHTDGLDSITVGNNSGDVLTNQITFHEAGTYYIIAELKSGDTSLAKGLATITTTGTEPPVSGEQPDPVESSIYVPYVVGTGWRFHSRRGCIVPVVHPEQRCAVPGLEWQFAG